MGFDTIDGYRETDRPILAQRYWVRRTDQPFPTRIEGCGLGFNGIKTAMTVSDLDIENIGEYDHPDCIYIGECEDMTFRNCRLKGARDETIDLLNCGVIRFQDCVFGNGLVPGHDFAALIMNTRHVIFERCRFEGSFEGRVPHIQNGLCSLIDCVIQSKNYFTGLYGPQSRLNILGSTRWERLPGGPARKPICLYQTQPHPKVPVHGQWSEPCVHIERHWAGQPWPNDLIHVYHPNGQRPGWDALWSPVPFEPSA